MFYIIPKYTGDNSCLCSVLLEGKKNKQGCFFPPFTYATTIFVSVMHYCRSAGRQQIPNNYSFSSYMEGVFHNRGCDKVNRQHIPLIAVHNCHLRLEQSHYAQSGKNEK